MSRTLLLVLALTLAGASFSRGTPASAAPTPQLDEDALRAFVLEANSDALYSEAYRTLNPQLLARAWAGEALLDLYEDIAGLRGVGQYLDLLLEDVEFRRIQELGPGRVRVVTLEYWLARLYRADQTYLGYQRQVVENRYLVEQRGDNWFIIEADQTIEGGDPVFRQGEP
jgi:hypothetical protein